MKKLILLITLALATASFAGEYETLSTLKTALKTATPTKAVILISDWLGRALTTNEIRFQRLLKPVYRAAQDEKVLSAKAWIEVPVERLQEPIPQVALDQFFGTFEDEEGNVTSTVTNMVLADFTFSVELSLNGTNAIIRAGAKEGVTYRNDRVTADNLAEWMSYLSNFGFSDDDLLTVEERSTLQRSTSYSIGEEDI